MAESQFIYTYILMYSDLNIEKYPILNVFLR